MRFVSIRRGYIKEASGQMEEQRQVKQRILSGIQPTGVFTLGNYMGAITNWEQMQEDYDCAYFIDGSVDLTVESNRGCSVRCVERKRLMIKSTSICQSNST